MAEAKTVSFVADAHVQRQLDDLMEIFDLRQSSLIRLAIDRLWLANFDQARPSPAADESG